MRIAILCSGLGNVTRGHEVFVASLFEALREELDITLFKGAGDASEREIVVPHVPRYAECLGHVHLSGPEKWRGVEEESLRQAVEFETFGYGALAHLLEGGYDIIHCAENVVSDIVYRNRLLFEKVPKVVYSNGGALPRRRLPACDFVQEHTRYNLERSRKQNAVYIPHGVDLSRFDPTIESDFRSRHGIPEDALVVLSVGNVSPVHKRMDYVIREVAQVDGAWLVIAGQRSVESDGIVELGERLMPGRFIVTRVPHAELPALYKAADIFALGSLFETFGIVYIEAMAMALPVIATRHENQRQIIREGMFADLSQAGAMRDAIRALTPERRAELGRRARAVVEAEYDYAVLKSRYQAFYQDVFDAPTSLPKYTFGDRVKNNVRNLAGRWLDRLL